MGPTFCPICDYSEAAIAAIKGTFDSVRVYVYAIFTENKHGQDGLITAKMD